MKLVSFSFSKNKSKIAAFLIISFLMISPILAYNYFLYKDKGIVDVYFSKIFNINREAYAYQAGIDRTFSFSDMIIGGAKMFWSLLKLEPLILGQ